MTDTPAVPQDDETPKVMLGGKEWPVPLLAIRQNRRIVPALMKLQGLTAMQIMTDQFDTLADIAHVALTRAAPQLAREAFEDMPISIEELMTALPIIARQTGAQKPGAAPAGEAKATA